MALLVEAWVRLSWDPKRGTPGFFVSDPVRGQRLSANYDGWFAGVPVHTNRLGFRSDRDFDLEKGPNTFRVVVLGDSVTFGHGAVHDYPSLLESLLKAWRPQVDWQVWNLGVPGYNTGQELAHLLEVGPTYQPDLVVVGFFINDIIGNEPVTSPGLVRREANRALALLQRHWYSVELYKRVMLTAMWRLSGTESSRLRFENLESEERLLTDVATIAEAKGQRLTPFTRVSDDEVEGHACPGGMQPSQADVDQMQTRPDWPQFLSAVQQFQDLNRQGTYRIVFFLNLVPPVCPDGDFFYDGKATENAFFTRLFGDGVPTVSAYPAFLRVRPSEMPLAEAHAIGNANQVKAEALAAYLESTVLPGLLPTALPRVR